MPLQDSGFQNRLETVTLRIHRAAERSGRDPSGIKLVAVTKKFSAETIRKAYQAGLRDFGENYVQEFEKKRPELNELADATCHLIGHLQSNKAGTALDLFQVIQTIDSSKLLKRLDSMAQERGLSPEGLIEVKLSDEENKTGTAASDLPALIEAAGTCRAVRVTGLMTVPPWSEDAEQSRPYFRKLAELGRQFGLPKLSMGMSDDFEVAIEEGAHFVRVGTALFGPRTKDTNPPAH